MMDTMESSNSMFLPLYNNPLHQSTLKTTLFQSSLSYSSPSSNLLLTTSAPLASQSHQTIIPASDPHINKLGTFKRKPSLKVKNIIIFVTIKPPIIFSRQQSILVTTWENQLPHHSNKSDGKHLIQRTQFH